MRVPERVAKRFSRKLVDVVANDRVQLARLALDANAECSRTLGAPASGELAAPRHDRFRQIVAFDGGYPQALDGVAPFGDRFLRLRNRTIAVQSAVTAVADREPGCVPLIAKVSTSGGV